MFLNSPRAADYATGQAAVERLLATFDNAEAAPFDLQMGLARAWGAGFVKPHLQLPRERWVEMFRRAGFFSLNGAWAPTEPVRLYRGAADGHERGMSWTTSPAIARRFDAALWTCLAPPSAVLAIFGVLWQDLNGDDLGEFVLDTTGLDIEESCAPGYGGVTLEFRGRTVEAVERNVRRFLAQKHLDDLRRSALGWEVVRTRRKHSLARVRFYGYDEVLLEVDRRHRHWQH